MLTREDWTRGSGSPPEIKGPFWYTDGSKMKEGTRAGVFGQSVKRRLSFPWVDIKQFSRQKYMLSWPVFMKFNFRTYQRNMSVYALVIRQH
jgi:hypothetical protein